MKKLFSTICFLALCWNYIPSYASQITTNEVNTPKISRPKYITQYFNGYNNSEFPKRSYYLPSYCQPGAAMHNGDYNPFCNKYKPYGSGMYINF